ncbi:MAG: alpha/beta hydrolase [Oscillospiraceae bacterium]|nr:alpha/beta hydrolase [Oscillospiraceae bacterium]
MFIDFNGKQIYAESHGQGTTIVLLSGLMMSVKSWRPFIPALSENNRLILLDFLDQGKSSRMCEPYDIALQVDAVKRVLDHLGITQAVLAGISYGASVCMQFALKYPEYVNRLALFNCVAYISPWIKDLGAGWTAARVSPEAYYHMTTPFFYSPGFYNRNLDWISARKDFLIENYFGDADFLDSIDRMTNSTNGHDVRERLCEIQVKTLIAGGRDDLLTPLAEQKYISERIPNASMVTIEDCGHATMYEKPECFLTLLTGFANCQEIKLQ